MAATFLSAIRAFGRASTFAALAGVALAGGAWVAAALPETAGKTLEEIEDLFRARADRGFRVLPDADPDRRPAASA